MRSLSAADLLDLLGRGGGRTPAERALLLLARAWPEAGAEERAALPVGRRDALLMALRVATFGAEAPLTAHCPDCGEELDASLDLARVLAADAGDGPAEPAFEHEGRRVVFRLPTSADLLASDAAALPRRLLRSIDGEAVDETTPLPPALTAALAAAVAAADPLAEVAVELVCDACGRATEKVFDVVTYFWAEIEAAARRLVQEIHVLASAYGWTEAQVLAVGPARRALYLELVRR